MQKGIDFEADVFSELEEYSPEAGWVFVSDDLERNEAVGLTVAAMTDGAGVIAGGWLPLDSEGRRAGKPDLLVRQGDGYVSVDVKHHLTLDASEDGSADVSALVGPFPANSEALEGWSLRKHKDDALQLAHYRRILITCGFAADSSLAGIIGKERAVVWYDLDAPMWQTPAKSDGRKRKTRTSMEVYDFEFDFRLDIAAVAHQHLRDASVELLVLPVRRAECGSCPWEDVCNVDLEAGTGDPSLVPSVRYAQWRTLREHGITDRAGVAGLHYPTAKLSAAGVNLSGLIDAATGVDPDTPIGDLLNRAPKQLAAARSAGLEVAADVLEDLDDRTVALSGGRWLRQAIVAARAVLGPAPVYRKPDRDVLLPLRADVEIDIDMENTNDGVYLWGAFVTDRAGLGLVEDGYHAFASWDPLTETSDLANFEAFWDWLSDVRTRADAVGATVAGYCWHENAENTQMRRIAAANPQLAADVEEFIDSDGWVDMMKVFSNTWTTGGSIGLKAVAPLAGFDWAVDDPGGGMSMVYHARMVDPTTTTEDRAQLRDWLLEYNRGDVEATLAIRGWLDTEGAQLPVVPMG